MVIPCWGARGDKVPSYAQHYTTHSNHSKRALIMFTKNYKALLSVGDIFIDQYCNSHKKITRVSLSVSKTNADLRHPVYYYVKCTANGREKTFDTGTCYAEAIDRQITNQQVLAKRA